jgi:hypothetical protein
MSALPGGAVVGVLKAEASFDDGLLINVWIICLGLEYPTDKALYPRG